LNPKDDARQAHGRSASSREFARYDQVGKPDYHLAEQAADAEAFDEAFQIPVCDLERCLRGDARDRRRFAEDLGAAVREIGFAILEGHGIDAQRFAQAELWVQEFFEGASLEEKLRFKAARHGSVSEGYFPLRATSAIHPDLVEGWVFGRRAFDVDGARDFDARRFWPLPEFEPRFRRLVEAQLPLVRPILQSLLAHVGCAPNALDGRLERPKFALRLNYYPGLAPAAEGAARGRLLGHEDVNLITLLPAPSIEGLQVLHRSGRWVRVCAPRGTIVLNVGDYLQRLTNDLLPSTTHRVSRPRDPREALRTRVSFPLATYLPEDDLLSVLPGIGQPKYEPIRVITFHTRTTAKFYGDDYAVEVPAEPRAGALPPEGSPPAVPST
jgi:isopenicillin N synthase-like dioxygenase